MTANPTEVLGTCDTQEDGNISPHIKGPICINWKPVPSAPGEAQKDVPWKDEWTKETMRIINKLTPSIVGKAFDPDWFLLRERFEAIENKVETLMWAIGVKDKQILELSDALTPAVSPVPEAESTLRQDVERLLTTIAGNANRLNDEKNDLQRRMQQTVKMLRCHADKKHVAEAIEFLTAPKKEDK